MLFPQNASIARTEDKAVTLDQSQLYHGDSLVVELRANYGEICIVIRKQFQLPKKYFLREKNSFLCTNMGMRIKKKRKIHKTWANMGKYRGERNCKRASSTIMN